MHTTFPQANSSGFAKLQICRSWYAGMNGELFYDFKVEKDYISMTPRPETVRENINRSYYIKVTLDKTSKTKL